MATSQFQRGGGVSGAASSSGGLDKVRAPYTFVPLSEHVFLPPWGEAASHDVPFEDGVCGTLDVEIEALSPLFIRGARDSKLFYETPDKTYAIPGTSIRGALRNVVEIATFSKLHRINDTRFAVRDLQNRTLYGNHMAEIQKAPDGKGIPVPLVNSGWLIPASQDEVDRGIGAWIVPCGFAKIHYKSILEIARKKGVHGYQPGRRQQSPEKYRTWLGDLGPEKGQERLDKLAVEFLLKPERQKDVARGLISTYGKASLPTGARTSRSAKVTSSSRASRTIGDPERPPMKRAGGGQTPSSTTSSSSGICSRARSRPWSCPFPSSNSRTSSPFTPMAPSRGGRRSCPTSSGAIGAATSTARARPRTTASRTRTADPTTRTSASDSGRPPAVRTR
jgi:hypothetical protein